MKIKVKAFNMNFNKYLVHKDSTIIETLAVIEKNKKKISVIFEFDGEKKKVVGVLTDGDIRRLLISGFNLSSKISFSKEFLFIGNEALFNDVITKFYKNSLDFVLILKDGELFNILFKDEFHSMLLEDVNFRTDIDYSIFEKNLTHEIYRRPWGFYKSVFINRHVHCKILTISSKSETSLQKHQHREEHWVVVKGCGEVINGQDRYKIYPGMHIKIPKQCVHKITNTSTKENLVISEVQIGEYFGEDDIVRLKDKYGRC